MPFIHGKSAAVLHGIYDLSAYMNNATTNSSVETGETTNFGSGGSKTYIAGLKDGTLSLAGLFDGAAGAVDVVLSGALGTNDVVTTVMPQGAGTIGNRAILAWSTETSYDVTTPVADVVSVSAEFQADGGIDNGVVLADLSARTASVAAGTAVDNSASSANGGVAHLHVTANTRNGSTTVKVQHSVDNSVWVDLVTFTAVGTSTTTSERTVVAAGTTVNRYLRHTMSIGGTTGSITYSVAFARR